MAVGPLKRPADVPETDPGGVSAAPLSGAFPVNQRSPEML
jgi:hypothetical protein